MHTIQQIYCTHCTYGTSALERREGELADRVLGYSARAGSLAPAELRKYYRHIERFLYYYLPTDAPAEEKLRLNAAAAPRRLVYCPSVGGLQFLGQLSYRPRDTAGRAGSYFGHVLLGDREAAPWSVLDCLKLWGAGWVDEDRPNYEFLLPALTTFDELRGRAEPAINDRVLLSFLTTPSGQAFDDPGRVIPGRWSAVAPSDRVALLVDLLWSFLELASSRREGVLVVVEPSLAALLFYGVARLLPEGDLRHQISFSTFEPDAQRVPVVLAATSFHSPQTSDVRPEAYRSRRFVINTFLNKKSEHQTTQGAYARLLVEKLVSGGWAAVDPLLMSFESAGAKQASDLEALAQTHALVPILLDPSTPLVDTQWRQSAVATHFLGEAVRRQLAGVSSNSSQLLRLVGSPNQLLILDLIATSEGAADRPGAVQFLLHNLPADSFPDLLASEHVATDCKVRALVDYIREERQFPASCDGLWSEKAASDRASQSKSILPLLLAALPSADVAHLNCQLPEKHSGAFLLALIHACQFDPSKQSLVGELVDRMDESQIVGFFGRHGAELRDGYPPYENVLADRLAAILDGLQNHPREFVERLDLLSAWSACLARPAQARLKNWEAVRKALLELRTALARRPKGLRDRLQGKSRRIDYNRLGEDIAGPLRNIFLSIDGYEDDERGEHMQEALREIGKAVVGRGDFLPDHIWAKFRNYFESGAWSHWALFGSRKRSSAWLLLFSLLVPLALFGLAALYVSTLKPNSPAPAPPPRGAAERDPGLSKPQSHGTSSSRPQAQYPASLQIYPGGDGVSRMFYPAGSREDQG